MSRVEKKQPQYGSDVVVDLMKALISSTPRSIPARPFAAFTIRSSTTAATTSPK